MAAERLSHLKPVPRLAAIQFRARSRHWQRFNTFKLVSVIVTVPLEYRERAWSRQPSRPGGPAGPPAGRPGG
jgi:hypothetical protein